MPKTPNRKSQPHRAWVLATSILASSLAMIDGSVVNVGLPAIGKSLHGSGEALQWVINAYLLPLSAILLLGGSLGDRFGRRRILILGMGVFALGSAGCTLAPGLPWLLAARAVQGCGAALLLPNSLAILGDAYPGKSRGQAVGIWAAVGAMMAALGPVVGGGLIDTVGWRMIFLLNLPIAAAAIGLALLKVKVGDRTGKEAPLDWLGAVLVTLALGGLTFAMSAASARHRMAPLDWATTAGGVLLLIGFVATEARLKDKAMVPLALFGSRGFVGLSLLTLLIYGVLGGFLVLLPYELIQASHYSATAAGSAILPFPLILACASPLTGALAARIGSRGLLIGGSLILAAGLGLALRIGQGAPYWTTVFPAVCVQALGMSGIAAPLTNAVLGSVGPDHTASASGLNSAISRLGGLIATASIGGVLAAGADVVGQTHTAILVSIVVTVAGGACALLVPGKGAASGKRGAKPAPAPRARHGRTHRSAKGATS